MRIRTVAAIAASLLVAGCSNEGSLDRGALQQLLADDLPAGLAIDEIRNSAIPGLLEVRVGAQVYYSTEDGKFIVSGEIIDRENEVNLTAASTAEIMAGMLAGVSRDQVHAYKPEGEIKRTVYVFTDPSCPYCQRFHQEIAALNAEGIEVVYLGFPREGVGSQAYAQLTGAFCSESPAAAFDSLMDNPGQAPAAAPCLSPVDFHYDLAARLQVQGTPAIFDDGGRQLGGYLTATQLLSALEG